MAERSGEPSALVVGDELVRLDRFVPALRRAGFSARRVLNGAAAIELVKKRPFDVIVVVLPFRSTRALLGAIRADGSPCSRTAAIVVAEESLGAEGAEVLYDQANRVLPPEATPEELIGVVNLLLKAEPRIVADATAQVYSAAQGGRPRFVKIVNVSTTGMLLIDAEPFPVDSVFGFELLIAGLSTPVRGQGRVVRHMQMKQHGRQKVAVNFVSFGGDGAEQLRSVIFQERAAVEAKGWRTGRRARKMRFEIRDAEELAVRKEELAELTPYLEGLLLKGLGPRVQTSEWYVAAAELGLESLRAFSAILSTVHGERARRSEATQQMADLNEVSQCLEEFGQQNLDLQARINLMLKLRRPLERILRELALTSAFEESDPSSTGARPRGLIGQLALDIKRLLRSRRVLGQLPALVDELQRARYWINRRALKRQAEEVCRSYSTWVQELGLDELTSRRGRRNARLLLDREIRRMDMQIALVHKQIYRERFRGRATGDLDADLDEEKLLPIITEIMAAGSSFLVRAYSAYRHSLELIGADPRLLDRIAGLSASVAMAERRLSVEAAKEAQ